LGGASGEPCFRQFYSDVGIHSNHFRATMQDVKENGVCHGKLCAEQSGGK